MLDQVDSSWLEYVIKGSRCMNFDIIYLFYILIIALNIRFEFRLFNTVLILLIYFIFIIEATSPFEFIT